MRGKQGCKLLCSQHAHLAALGLQLTRSLQLCGYGGEQDVPREFGTACTPCTGLQNVSGILRVHSAALQDCPTEFSQPKAVLLWTGSRV